MNGRQLFTYLVKHFGFDFFSSTLKKEAFLKELRKHPFGNPEEVTVSHLDFLYVI